MKKPTCQTTAHRVYCYAWQCSECPEINLRQEVTLGEYDTCDGCASAIRIVAIHYDNGCVMPELETGA